MIIGYRYIPHADLHVGNSFESSLVEKENEFYHLQKEANELTEEGKKIPKEMNDKLSDLNNEIMALEDVARARRL